MPPKTKIIHINQHVIRANKKNGTNDPVITVKCGKRNVYGHEVDICGPSKVVYSPQTPLSCGARVWITTTAPVLVDGEEIELSASTACDLLNDALQTIGRARFVKQHFNSNFEALSGLYFDYDLRLNNRSDYEQHLVAAGAKRNSAYDLKWMGFTIKPHGCDI